MLPVFDICLSFAYGVAVTHQVSAMAVSGFKASKVGPMAKTMMCFIFQSLET